MASIPLFAADGKEIGTLPLPDSIFGVPFNQTLVHQAIVTEEANARQGTHSVKTRAAVRGGGRKPWRQKGTGRARQGSIRSPQWKGGGIVGGPTPRSYRKAFPVKMRRAALRCVLSGKVAEGKMIGLDALHFDAIKTKQAVALLKALNLSDTRRILVIIPEYDLATLKSMRNLQSKGVELRFAPNFSVRDALNAHKIVLVKDALARIEAVWTPDSARENEDEDTEETDAPGDAAVGTTEEVAA